MRSVLSCCRIIRSVFMLLYCFRRMPEGITIRQTLNFNLPSQAHTESHLVTLRYGPPFALF